MTPVVFLSLLLPNTSFPADNDYLYKAIGLDASFLRSSGTVKVAQTGDVWSFSPTKSTGSATLVFCYGSQVEPTAYAPLARRISENGFSVVLIKLGAKYDSLEAQKQDGVARIRRFVSERGKGKFVVGGHSLGAAIAARFANENPGLLSGLLLCATTHPRDFSLSMLKMPVAKIYATKDGVARQDQVERNKSLLPVTTQWRLIEGGNHAQFGFYGQQSGDGIATISREKQQEIVLQEALKLLRRASEG